MSELYPIEIRGVANSLAYSIGNIMMFASIQSFYGLLSIFNGVAGIQWFFAVISLLACVYTYIFLPETHRKSLDEITDYFIDNSIYILSKKKSKAPKITNANRIDKKDLIKSNNEQSTKLMDNV